MSVKLDKRLSRKNIIGPIIVLLALYVLAPRLPSFKDSFSTLSHADFAYLGLGVLFWLATFLAAAMVYVLIALKPVPYRLTLFIQLASGFTNRLVPGGAGAIALNVRYLMKRGHSAIQATALATFNNILGFVGNVILLLGAILLSPSPLDTSFKIHIQPSAVLILVIACLVVGLGLLAIIGSKLAIKIRRTVQLIAQNARRRPSRLIVALLASMTITALYALVLYCMGLAFNVHLSVVQTLLVLTLGVVAATITPTPGGIGGAEAGMVAALIAVGVTPHQALTVALTYRFLVYWLPILPGFICFQAALRKRYI